MSAKDKSVEFPTIRDWLNPIQDWDSGLFRVTGSYEEYETHHDSTKTHKNMDINFELSDCSQKIILDFSCTNKKVAAWRLEKVQKLKGALTVIESYLLKYINDDIRAKDGVEKKKD